MTRLHVNQNYPSKSHFSNLASVELHSLCNVALLGFWGSLSCDSDHVVREISCEYSRFPKGIAKFAVACSMRQGASSMTIFVLSNSSLVIGTAACTRNRVLLLGNIMSRRTLLLRIL